MWLRNLIQGTGLVWRERQQASSKTMYTSVYDISQDRCGLYVVVHPRYICHLLESCMSGPYPTTNDLPEVGRHHRAPHLDCITNAVFRLVNPFSLLLWCAPQFSNINKVSGQGFGMPVQIYIFGLIWVSGLVTDTQWGSDCVMEACWVWPYLKCISHTGSNTGFWTCSYSRLWMNDSRSQSVFFQG